MLIPKNETMTMVLALYLKFDSLGNSVPQVIQVADGSSLQFFVAGCILWLQNCDSQTS